MKTVFLPILCVFALTAMAQAREAPSQRALRILIAYFSHTNNTRSVAESIQRQVGGDLFHITTQNPYPRNHQMTVSRARMERDQNMRPELASLVPAEVMQQYDIVFLGYPNWWLTMPMAVLTFLDQHELSGKYIVPFCTHEGSGLSNSVAELRQLQPNAMVLEGLAVNGRAAARAQDEVANWLHQIGIVR